MANYLPVLLVSVTAGMPDDAALQPLPRGQVDYLSHDWAEEDVWRSWRNMTKQKNEIANGVRLENASWRTWMKQRNKLKTISPETLNWLKDSDVTWLYGPLHTAVDWAPPPKPSISPSAVQHTKDDASALPPKSLGASSLSSPSSSVALDRFSSQTGRYALPSHEGGAMKPILKHRSIAEMLTSALPPAPSWAEGTGEHEEEFDEDDEVTDSAETRSLQERHEASFSGRGGRPPLFHTKSDTNILPRFGRGGARKRAHISPPRVAAAAADREPQVSPYSYSGSLSANQRTGASNNLAEMVLNAGNTTGAHTHTNSLQGSASPFWNAVPLENTESSGASTFSNDAASNGRPEGDGGALSPAASLAPQKKHISFNAIVEQCIAIDGGSAPMTPSTHGKPWSTYEDDGYTQDTEDGLYEDVSMGMRGDSDSDDARVEDGDEDEILEIKPPSRRSSSSSLQDYRAVLETHQQPHPHYAAPSAYPERPQFRRSSTGSSRLGRSRGSASAGSGSGSGSNSGQTSETGRSRSNVALDREHVTIAPIAPTILKAGGAEDSEDGMLYMGGAPYSSYGATQSFMSGGGAYSNSHGSGSGGTYTGTSGSGGGYGYGYGGYGYGERVSAGRDDAFEHFERGTDAGELVYQSPNGSVYPWGEGDAVRFRMQAEFGIPSPAGSPPRGYGLNSPQQSPAHRIGSTGSSSSSVTSSTAYFVPGPFVNEPSCEEGAEEAEFEYFDAAEETHEVEADDSERMDVSDDQEAQTSFVSRGSEIRREKRNEDDGVRIVVPYSNGGADRVDQRSPQPLDSGLPRERTPSPDFQPKINPRIASLKSESGYRSPPPPSSPSLSYFDIGASLVPSSPTLAIPTPGISPAHEQDYVQMRSPPESPVMQAGLLSPPDMSPRGRSICDSPVSGSATSSSAMQSGSRSVSESRSDSRGRSRTRNSSLASSSDQGEPDRGRSRSRSTASGANSPLGESSSPHARCPPLAIGGIGMGLGIGAGFGAQHSGREVRDGRGVRLYRKTSEDFIRGGTSDGKGGQPDNRTAQGSRGRNREGKRVSESLSPPVVGSVPADRRSTVSPPTASASYRPIPSSGLKSYSVNTSGGSVSGESNHYGVSNKHLLLNGVPIVNLPEATPLAVPRRSNPSRSGSREHLDTASTDNSSPLSGSVSSTVTASGRTLPSCIPEEDEQRSRTVTPTQVPNHTLAQKPSQSDLQTKLPSTLVPQAREKTGTNRASSNATPSSTSSAMERTPSLKAESPVPGSSSNVSMQVAAGRNKANGASDSANDDAAKTFADRAAELVSSARTLLGTIWNGS